jgi:membrane protein implicated in regulation of membrane protease activity
MSSRRGIGIALFVVAVIAAIVGVFLMSGGHNKTGIGLIVIAVIVLAVGLFSFFSRSTSQGGQVDNDMLFRR